MRKNYQMWLLGALVGGLVLPFAGCSNEDDPTPNESGNGETVKTEFTINIPYAGKAETKMSGENTQQDGKTFLGMSNIRLIPYVSSTSWDGTIDRIRPLDAILNNSAVSNNTGDGTHETQKTYSDIDIPVGTNKFLFYGEATYGTSNDYLNQGGLIANIDGSTKSSDINFKLIDIYSSTNTDFSGAQNALVALLNQVENANITDGGTGSDVVTWASYSSGSFSEANDLMLQKLYNTFITMKAGSATSIRLLMQSLYTEVDKFDNQTGSTNAEKLAFAIKTAITTEVSSLLKLEESSGNLVYSASTSENISQFPAKFNLPDGAVRVKYVADAECYFEADNFTLDVSGSSKLKIENLTYPSSLYYFVNSGLKASDKTSAAFPANGSWGAEETWTDWGQDVVTSSTRKIAMVEPVEYGVGLLKTTVQCSVDGLLDKDNNTINIGTEGFTLTGVLIGGQPDIVGWNMYSAGTNWNKVIYDGAVDNSADAAKVTTTACSPNYTLALDNSRFTETGRDDSQEPVYIAVELQNNTGENIVGIDGVIYDGAKFYLVAELIPTNSTNQNSIEKPSVFMQDYMTTANLKITALKSAYNTIPDLRSSSLEFGLSVDLDWKTGISFDVNIGQ